MIELPYGETSNVNGRLAVFIPSFATSQQELRDKRPSVSAVTNYSYETTNLLSWFIGEIKNRIVFQPILRRNARDAAESLKPMYIYHRVKRRFLRTIRKNLHNIRSWSSLVPVSSFPVEQRSPISIIAVFGHVQHGFLTVQVKYA